MKQNCRELTKQNITAQEDAFVSSDSAESVTEGIDIVAVPVSNLSEATERRLS